MSDYQGNNIQYTMGVIKAQVEGLIESVDQINEDIAKIKESTQKLDRWEARLGGAMVVLAAIGSVLLYCSDLIIGFIQKKLGL